MNQRNKIPIERAGEKSVPARRCVFGEIQKHIVYSDYRIGSSCPQSGGPWTKTTG
jgi:hypothetical protein